ncbi:hypothetical protein [Corynebacterium sp. HS2168-gen11]|uniref:hypothetical protein n=1 Tax=Corynebacterium sp. HS2168-gen11 TaxID=2974027 RepID=UPI00216B1970|nr:hypothetical protein [Corynebacterium sp. HS2168-gen11]MCS4536239.1 hypothetical protein [Corynebacterium sp. HS2168-gen11]
MISPVSVRAMMYKLYGELPSEEEVSKKYHQMLEMVDSLAQTYYQTWMRNDPPADEKAAAALLNQATELATEEVMESEISEPIRRYMEHPMSWDDPIQEILRMDDDELEMMGTTRAQLITEAIEEDIKVETMTNEEYKEYLNEILVSVDKTLLRYYLAQQPETNFGCEDLLEQTVETFWEMIQKDPSLDPRPKRWLKNR